MPAFWPFFIGLRAIVTLSPNFSVDFVHPRRARKLGLMPSIAQVSKPPLPFGTSTQIHEWGFVHSNRFTVPAIVFSTVRSKGAKEWWAFTVTTDATRLAVMTPETTRRRMMPFI